VLSICVRDQDDRPRVLRDPYTDRFAAFTDADLAHGVALFLRRNGIPEVGIVRTPVEFPAVAIAVPAAILAAEMLVADLSRCATPA